MPSSLRTFPTLGALAEAAALEVTARAADAIARRGRFLLALSGGSTPRALYELLAAGGTPPFRDRIDWSRIWALQGDERAVPPDHLDSNFAMQQQALLGRVPLPPEHILRFAAEGANPDWVASEYEALVRERLGLAEAEWPVLDLALLGLGADGHTASLFPGTTALSEERRLAVATRVESLGSWRYTLTLPVLNRARAVMFLVAGADKAATLARVVRGPGDPAALPAGRVRPASGEIAWLVDAAAAAELGP